MHVVVKADLLVEGAFSYPARNVVVDFAKPARRFVHASGRAGPQVSDHSARMSYFVLLWNAALVWAESNRALGTLHIRSGINELSSLRCQTTAPIHHRPFRIFIAFILLFHGNACPSVELPSFWKEQITCFFFPIARRSFFKFFQKG